MATRTTTAALFSLPLLASLGFAQTPLDSTRIVSGLSDPVWAGAPPGDERLFILEQGGDARIFKDGLLLPTPFLSVAVSGGSEQGLLGMDFHPGFESNGFVYVNYTQPDGDTIVSRFTVDALNPDIVDPASEFVLFEQDQPFSNHNGGDIAFGPDGYLYIGFGDGGSANDPFCNAQDLSTWLGKMLRIDVDGGSPYAVPSDNPFVGTAGALPEIWHLGLRNPWRWSFDALTGDTYIGDVGQNVIEEISFGAAGVGGLNFGWKIMEGNNCFSTLACPGGIPACMDPVLTDPIQELVHTGFSGPLAIIGGFVYRGCAIPDLAGTYFYADFNDDKIRSIRYDPMTGVTDFMDRTSELAPGGGLSIKSPSAFGEDGFGELLIVDYDGGEVFKIVPASPPAGLVDCDGNGRDDTCEIAEDAARDLDLDGTLDVCQTLSADVGAISASVGETQTLALHAGAAAAGKLYVLIGSSTGNVPGFDVLGTHVPLNFDDYTIYCISFPNQDPLLSSFGVLDGNGDASAAISLANFSVPPQFIGLTVAHAYIAFGGGTPALASNFVTVQVLP